MSRKTATGTCVRRETQSLTSIYALVASQAGLFGIKLPENAHCDIWRPQTRD